MSGLLSSSRFDVQRYARCTTIALLLAGMLLALGCNDGDDDDEAVLELDPVAGGVYDPNAYSAAAAADSLTGLWLLVANYDYIIDDLAVRGAGRELARASVRIEDEGEFKFTSCYTGTPTQTPQRRADGSFAVELSGGVVGLTPNADNNVLTGSFIGNAGTIDFQGALTLVKLSAESDVKLGGLQVTSAALDEEAALDVDCFFEAEQALADSTGTSNPTEIVIRLSSSNQNLSDLYVQGSSTDQILRIRALQGTGRDVNFEFITPTQAIGVNKASTADITVSGSNAAGLQASLGAAEGNQQASVAVDIALP